MRNLLIPIVLLAVAGSGAGAGLEKALDLYRQTRYEDTLELLSATEQKDAATYALMAKCEYRLGKFKDSTEFLEHAVKANPNRSEYYDWLGKAYGRRAETSSFLTAPGHASKARDAFQKAVELDPKNLEATSDLFQYYLEAPGFLGGGLDKAAALAEQIKKLDPAEYHWAQAKLAEKRKESNTAEQQLRMAASLAPRQVSRLIDLAKFLARQGRYTESDATFRQAERIAPNDPQLLFAQASEYITANRNLETARQLLERYLSSQLSPDDPSRKEAEALLKKAASG